VPDAKYEFIKNPGTWVFYIPEEYEFLKTSRGGIICPDPKTRFRKLEGELICGVKLEGVWSYCPCEGYCDDPAKPLSCMLVPFLPFMDLDGNVIDVSPFEHLRLYH